MDGPPSLAAAIARNSDEQPPQLTDANHSEEANQNPSMSKLRSYSSFEDQTVDRAPVVQPAEIGGDDGAQPVSVGDMAAIRAKEVQMSSDESGKDESGGDSEVPAPSREFMVGDRGNSQPAGGVFSYSAPPSQGEIGRHDGSHNGGSGGGDGGGALPVGDYEQMSFNGRNFARVRETMVFP